MAQRRQVKQSNKASLFADIVDVQRGFPLMVAPEGPVSWSVVEAIPLWTADPTYEPGPRVIDGVSNELKSSAAEDHNRRISTYSKERRTVSLRQALRLFA